MKRLWVAILLYLCVLSTAALGQEADKPATGGNEADSDLPEQGDSGARKISVTISLTKEGRVAPTRPMPKKEGEEEDVEEAPAAEYFATYDVTDVSRFYTAETSATQAAMDYQTSWKKPAAAGADTTAGTTDDGEKRSGKDIIAEARAKADQLKRDEEEKVEQAKRDETAKIVAVHKAFMQSLERKATDETATTATDGVAETAAVPAEDLAERAERIFASFQGVKELSPYNAHFYAHQNLPFFLFLRCNCADDYYYANALEGLANRLAVAGVEHQVLLLWVAPEWRDKWQLAEVFGLQTPLDVLIGNSDTDIKTVLVKYPVGVTYDSVAPVITNECCGDKFTLRTQNLTPRGLELVVERLENAGTPGWGQFLRVRIDGTPVAPSRFPTFVIDNLPMGANNEKFVYPGPPSSVTDETLYSFIQGFIGRTLPPTVRSQPVPVPAPRHTPGKVLDVYGDTFAGVVMDPSKDVLVLIYSPYCGGSQAVMPLLSQVAEQFSKDPSVIVAQFDKTSNDFPIRGIRVTHYPTLFLFPTGDFHTAEYQFLDFDDYNGSKEKHRQDVPHSHFSLENVIKFVQDKDQMGSGSHFHLATDVGALHDRAHQSHAGHSH